MVSLGINIGIPNSVATQGLPAWVPSGANWYAEYAPNERGYIDTTTYNSLASLLASSNASFARTASGLYLPTSGEYTSFASGAVRVGDKGLLVEPALTDYAKNNALAGASVGVVGAGGSLPDLWRKSSQSGYEIEVLGVGVEYGLPYIDLSVSYSNSTGTTQYPNISHTTSPEISVGNSETWCFGSFAKWLSGTHPSSAPYVQVRKNRNSGTYTYYQLQITGDVFTRYNQTLVTDATGTIALQLNPLQNTVADGLSINYAIRLYSPHMHLGASPLTPILYSSAEAARDADVFTLFPDAGTYDITITFDDDSTQVLSSQVITGSGWQIPTNLNRRYIKGISGAAA